MSTEISNNTRLAIFITTIIVTCTLILDRLIPEGLFLDGVTYASISRNLANGQGSFWQLYYHAGKPFSEHPPLMFGMEALFFKILGDHYLTEKAYSFFIWLNTSLLIIKLWKEFTAKDKTKYTFALPMLLWCISPTVTWGYTSNILDCTMAMFDIAAVYVFYKSCTAQSWKSRTTLTITAALLTTCAILTKGPVGAFPLATPAVYWLVFRKQNEFGLNKAIIQIAVSIISLSVIYVILIQSPEAKGFLNRYLQDQLFAALKGEREVTGGLGRWTILFDLFIQLIPTFAFGILIFIIKKLSKAQNYNIKLGRNAVFMLFIGLCGSLPIMLSVKQRTFYIIPALPFYVMAISLIILPGYISITNRLKMGLKGIRYFKVTAAVITPVLCVYLGSKVGQIGRDKELIQKMHYLSTQFTERQIFGICQESGTDYYFTAYLQRYCNMELSTAFYSKDYVLINTSLCNNDIIPIINKIGFRQEPLEMDGYVLYKRHFPVHFQFSLLNPVFRTGDKLPPSL